MYQKIDHEAEAFVGQLWRDLYNRMRALLHPHYYEHGPGGRDQIRIPLDFLDDVTITSVANGQVLTYSAASDEWVNGAGGTGGGGVAIIIANLFGDLVMGSATTTITNLTAGAITFNKVQASCNPAAPTGGLTVRISVGGTPYDRTIAAAATASSVLTQAGSWAAGADLSAAIAALTGTYTGTVTVMLADGT